MKKILVLVSKKSEQRDMFVRLLQKYLGDKVEVSLALFPQISFELQQGKANVFVNGVDIHNFNLIYFKNTKGYTGLAKSLGVILDFLGIPYVDSLWGKTKTGNKVTSLCRLAIKGIPVLPTLYCNLANTKLVEKFINEQGLPLIAKELSLQGLRGVYVIKSIEDLSRLPIVGSSGQKQDYLFQKFVDIGIEYRLLVLGDKVEIAHTKVKRDYQGDKVTYLDWGSRIDFIDPAKISENIKNLAIKSAKIVGLEIAGVDIAIEKGSKVPWLIEVNRGPGFEYDMPGDPEIQKVAQFLEKQINK